MDPGRRTDRDQGPDDRGWPRRRTVLLFAAFAVPVVLLVFAGSLLVVPLIYLAVFVEGVFVALAAVSEVRSAERSRAAGYGGGPAPVRARPGADRVESLASYVKWAAKGSDFSRRDVARTVMRIAGHAEAAPSGGPGSPSDTALSGALETLVRPYLDDPFVKAGMRTLGADRARGGETGAGPKARPQGRARYLANLEDVVARLEQAMDRSGSA